MKTSEQIIEDAKTIEDIPNDYNLLEMQLFLMIKQILTMYYNKQISKENANNKKQQAIKKYHDLIKQYEFERSMFKEHIENIKKTENLRIKLRKQLNSNGEITEERLCETLNTCLELIELYSGEELNEIST